MFSLSSRSEAPDARQLICFLSGDAHRQALVPATFFRKMSVRRSSCGSERSVGSLIENISLQAMRHRLTKLDRSPRIRQDSFLRHSLNASQIRFHARSAIRTNREAAIIQQSEVLENKEFELRCPSAPQRHCVPATVSGSYFAGSRFVHVDLRITDAGHNRFPARPRSRAKPGVARPPLASSLRWAFLPPVGNSLRGRRNTRWPSRGREGCDFIAG